MAIQVQQIQQRAMKTFRKLEHMKYKEKLQEVGLFSLGKRKFMGDFIAVLLQSVAAMEWEGVVWTELVLFLRRAQQHKRQWTQAATPETLIMC